MAGKLHNEYVADSEDEDLLVDPTFDVLDTSVAAHSIHTPDTSIDISAKVVSHTSAIPALPALPQASTSSSSPGHTHLESAPSSLKDASSEPPKPRPRPKPRPKYKIQPSAIVADSMLEKFPPVTAHTDSSVLGPPPPVPLPKSLTPVQPALPIEFVGDIAERTKMRSRTKALDGGQKRKSIGNDVIELTSDSDDEMSLLPPTKAKGKAKDTDALTAKGRSPKRLKIADDSNTNMVSETALHSSSQLPPSDPPPPSSSITGTLHLGLDSSPPSSPIPRPPPRKRKRATVLQSDDDFQVDRGSQKLMPPPPPRLVPTAAEISPHQLPPPVPAEVEPSSSKVKNPKPKPKGKKKKTVEEEEEEEEEEDWKEDPMPKGRGKKSVVNDDDDDDDWNAKPKPKPKASRKTQKKTKVADAAETKAKGKGKGKQTGPPLVLEVLVSPPKRSSPQKPSLSSARDEKEELDALPGANATILADRPSDVMQDASVDTTEQTPQLGKGKKGKGKARKRTVLSSDEDESDSSLTSRIAGKKQTTRPKIASDPPLESRASPAREDSSKENDLDMPFSNPLRATNTTPARAPPSTPAAISRASSVIPKTTNTPMSELIRRVNSKPGSPFTASRPSYSPFAKSSKSMLKRIAPLHPNRRTPPPPPPRPPPPKKTKKQLEMEERWEMELEDTVEGWFAMGDEERAALRRAKRDAVFGVDD